MQDKKVMLIIMDGWGLGDHSKADAIYNANTPNIDNLTKEYPYSQLQASGKAVGLPSGFMGNSEVGHLSIGAGRVILESLMEINNACESNEIADNEMIKEIFSLVKKKNRKLHLLGLLSDAGIHSMNSHLYKLCELASQEGLKNVYIHAFTDGRDTDPDTGVHYLQDLQKHLDKTTGILASVIGRYYSMDRDQRWERTKEAYDLLTKGKGKKSREVVKTVENFYKQGITDEFMKPIVMVDKNDKAIAKIEEDDIVVCFNFRTDRLRQLTIALTQRNLSEFKMKTIPLHYYTMTEYDKKFKGVKVIFPIKDVVNTLGEVVSKEGLKQLRIAETEKYPHVTFFFSGRREKEFVNEDRIVIPSPKVATYDLQPEMSAPLITKKVIQKMKEEKYNFICLNFANADMVGHTGVYSAIVKAVETVDKSVGEIVQVAKETGYTVLIIADHGNADKVINEDGSVNTRHSLNPVPCILVNSDYKKIKDGILADVAPTILKLMNIDIPSEMTGKTLI